ncbi:MAG: hypothetical protein O7G31_11830 [Calditrichaeota bacterium]|nr:hypothetical protein [Calditrichota bacterium]
MGQQQLLLLVLSTIIVGVSIVVGIGMFQDSAMNANIDTVTQQNVTIASQASEWFNKSAALGGGDGAFDGCTLEVLGYSTEGVNIDSSDVGAFTITTATGFDLVVRGDTAEQDDTGGIRRATTNVLMDATGAPTITTVVTAP